jgi:hypothetical protein
LNDDDLLQRLLILHMHFTLQRSFFVDCWCGSRSDEAVPYGATKTKTKPFFGFWFCKKMALSPYHFAKTKLGCRSVTGIVARE